MSYTVTPYKKPFINLPHKYLVTESIPLGSLIKVKIFLLMVANSQIHEYVLTPRYVA
jgi:hypothetical protein